MTRASREQHITQALSQYQAERGTRDTLRVPLRGGQVLEVVELPLDLPLLNASSFRIAPALADHPQADLVRHDPESAEAQRIVADLVRQSHRQLEELKDSLVDGQDQPGVITRSGKLLNANTRCVLLRELWREGRIKFGTIRVAVLQSDVTEAEELQLESVLQRQREHKDEYNLVSELMMITKLHDDAGMSDVLIAKQLRIRGGEQRVFDLRAVLELMERARRLGTVTLPLSDFITEKDQRQNWLELLTRVRDADRNEGMAAGDDVIRRWLIAFHLGQSAVHRVRHANGAWVEQDVITDLADGADPAAAAVLDSVRGVAPEAEPAIDDIPDGLDLLGDDPVPNPSADSVAVKTLLDIAVATKQAGEGDVTLPAGKTLPAADVRAVLNTSVKRSLDTAKRRAEAGSRLVRPASGLVAARTGLKDAVEALDAVIDEPQFQSQRENVLMLVDEVSVLLERIVALLQPDMEAIDAYAADV